MSVLGAITVPGYASTIFIISFFCGLILFSLGIISEYISKIIREVSGIKRFPIRNRIP